MSSHPSIQSAVSNTFTSDAAPAPGGITAKLQNRILSSKTLSKEVNIVILSLHSALNPSGDKAEGDDELSSQSHEPQVIDPPATANRRGVVEASEDSDSGDESSGSTDSDTSAQHPRHHSAFDRTSHSPLLPDDASQTLGTDSVFLPALSNGFIPGGSDTDWSDSEARAIGGVRKNRRGQRARRA